MPPISKATLSINLEAVGELPTAAGYILVWDDDEEQLISVDSDWQDGARLAGRNASEYAVNGSGQLVHKENGKRVTNTISPYILLHVSAAEEPELKDFQPTAASAALVEKFVEPKGSLVEDVAELAEAYNDLIFLKKVASLDQDIKSEKDPEAKKKLKESRSAVLKLIQSRDVKELVE